MTDHEGTVRLDIESLRVFREVVAVRRVHGGGRQRLGDDAVGGLVTRSAGSRNESVSLSSGAPVNSSS